MSFEDGEIKQNEISQNKSRSNGLIIGLIVAVGAAAFFAGMYVSNINSNQISQEDLDNAIAKLELKMLQNRLPTNQPSPPVNISADDDPIIGNPDAPITIIEFSDFQCPFCARFHVQTLPLLLDEYIEQGKVKLVFRDFPIQSIHPNALPAAVAAECANEQGQFKAMHDMLFDNQNQWNDQETVEALTMFSQYATQIQLDQETFDSCLTSGKYIEEIRNDLEDGRSYDVTGTPGFFIGNDEIGYVELKGAQPFESFKKVIDAQLEA
ncbi:Na antiporter NhaA 2 protein [Marine Group I thaumarchaeote SCGC AAA799-E16]|uniref:Na antiporter NhaA 2 protein n=6 Tax=Marine Group I TaxID=905826 RepID=A0A087S6J6_9ARCH|nr:Na antiporter NhaA 2 protein [Marine Group I thaumarchaeote SCGC AAA799-N04]KER06133.1 Na antiporter NhaA 2 protein [Marine Group I thaumarchaeote SCGC AAA799-E16]KFM15869.1 Na antiporter NhaA 2 protein [Marine Group I thaumarchaeote SCGC AAA799-D11]KFM17434.1 Na antiporter NhaA 1 protein [Marine Group I thaumarchaeote SCGC RSA3]KFM20282.1 Na antiporter NhaA 2 protein [Marine Group I thaumarchaeote SCGC AAA799-P11]KFM21350.1 Na antiporter NhaA 2 protein [Marine Group I thaumarchaeote SCGC A